MKNSNPILVLGDLMLDHYIKGESTRLSPEAPVPVVHVKEEIYVLGGAANVANNLASINIPVALCGVLGKDDSANLFKSIILDTGIKDHTYVDTEFQTIVKTRVLSGFHQLVRYDKEEIKEPQSAFRSFINDILLNHLQDAQYLIVSDYGKGLCSNNNLDLLRNYRNNNSGIKVFIDPKGNDWNKYREFDLVKPNLKELNDIVKWHVSNEDSEIVNAAREVMKQFDLGSILVTRSEKGMSYITDNEEIHIRAESKAVFDVTGAGDTVIAVLTGALNLGYSREESLNLANKAAGFVVSKSGTTAVDSDFLFG